MSQQPVSKTALILLLVWNLTALTACIPETEEVVGDTGTVIAPDTGDDGDTGTVSGPDTGLADTGAETGPPDDTGTEDAGVDTVTLDLEEGCNPLATSSECVLPLPSSFYQDEAHSTPTGLTNDIPAQKLPVPDTSPPFETDFVNTADGASPNAPILLHFGFDVKLENLPGIDSVSESMQSDSPIAVFDMETGERVPFFAEMDENRKPGYPNRYAFIIRPVEPLKFGHRHAVVLTENVQRADGSTIDVPRAFEVLRDGTPTTNAPIERARGRYDEIFSFLKGKGYERGEMLLAWDFTVASRDWVIGPVLEMRKEALEYAKNDNFSYTITEVVEDPRPGTAKVVKGTFQVPTFITDDNTLEFTDGHDPVRQKTEQSFPFTMVIPEKANKGQPLPLTVFGHGLFGTGRDYLAGGLADKIQPLAQKNGVVMIATDWIGLSGGDLQLILQELIPDINRIGVVTDRLAQALINNFVLTKLALGPLQEHAKVKVGGHQLLDTDEVYYYGVSLGGIQGASFVSISDEISRGVLSVPGSMWATMLSRSIHWRKIKPALDGKYPDPLLQQIGIALIQYYFDVADPANLSRLMYKTPLSDAPKDRTVLLQEAVGDSQVPNVTTRALARAMGVGQITPAVDPIFDVMPLSSPTSRSALVQYHLESQTMGNMPPDTNVPPMNGNNVHSDILFLDPLQKQLTHFVNTGEIKQFCMGPCNPK